MREILAHGIEDAKESSNQKGHFLDFHRFSWSYAGPSKAQLEPLQRNVINGIDSPEIVYYILYCLGSKHQYA